MDAEAHKRKVAEELAAAKEASAQQWFAEHAGALREINDWMEKNGLPLAKHRLF